MATEMLKHFNRLHMGLCKGADGNEYKYDNAEYTNGKFTMTNVQYRRLRRSKHNKENSVRGDNSHRRKCT
ncbi:hypothetical protein AM593_05459, partial [Mytilus galloprovincialis]